MAEEYTMEDAMTDARNAAKALDHNPVQLGDAEAATPLSALSIIQSGALDTATAEFEATGIMEKYAHWLATRPLENPEDRAITMAIASRLGMELVAVAAVILIKGGNEEHFAEGYADILRQRLADNIKEKKADAAQLIKEFLTGLAEKEQADG